MNIRSLIRSPYLRLIFWAALIGLMLYLALRNVDLAVVWQTLRQANLAYIGLAVLSVAISTWAKAVRWQVLIGPAGTGISFSKILMVLVSGQTLNWYLPGRVGELSRAYLIGGMGPGRIYVLGTVALEKVLDMFFYALLFVLLVLVLPLPDWIRDSGLTFTLVSGLVVLAVVILSAFPGRFAGLLEKAARWLPERLRAQVVSRFLAGLESLKVVQRRADLFKIGLLSVLVWGSAVWTNFLTFQALNMELSWTAAVVLLVVLQAGISVPTVPGRIGLFQYLCILSLALFGIDQAAGLSYGILLQAIVLLPPTLLTVIILWSLGWGGFRNSLPASSEN